MKFGSLLVSLLATAILDASAVAQESQLRLRGRRLHTKDSLRQTEILLEGIDDELKDDMGRAGVELEFDSSRRVDPAELRARTLAIYTGNTVTKFPELVQSPSDAPHWRKGRQVAGERTEVSKGPLFASLAAIVLLIVLFAVGRRRSQGATH